MIQHVKALLIAIFVTAALDTKVPCVRGTLMNAVATPADLRGGGYAKFFSEDQETHGRLAIFLQLLWSLRLCLYLSAWIHRQDNCPL
jgi:steroid 5-alpha reductase family enzyme